jgi:thiol-disulfide isomerase/thioredoxin
MKPWIVGVLGFFLAASAGCQGRNASQAAVTPNAQSVISATEAKIFPEFIVKSLDNRTINLSSYRGKPLILDLFATWCPPCRMEIPHFVELQNEFQGKVAIVGLSYDQGSAKQVQEFAKSLNVNYDIFWGSEDIAQFVGLRGIPHTLIIDAQGRIRQNFVGYREKEVFRSAIAALLAETEAPSAL